MKRRYIPILEDQRTRVSRVAFTPRDKRGLPPGSKATVLMPRIPEGGISVFLTPKFSELEVEEGKCGYVIDERTQEPELRELRQRLYIQYRIAYRAFKKARHRWTERFNAYRSELRRTLRSKSAQVSVLHVEVMTCLCSKKLSTRIQREARTQRADFVHCLRGLQDDGIIEKTGMPFASIRFRNDEPLRPGISPTKLKRLVSDYRSGTPPAWQVGQRGQRVLDQGWVLPGVTTELRLGAHGFGLAGSVYFIRVREDRVNARTQKRKARLIKAYDPVSYKRLLCEWVMKHPRPRTYRDYCDTDRIEELRKRIHSMITFHQCDHVASSGTPVRWQQGVTYSEMSGTDATEWRKRVYPSNGNPDSMIVRNDPLEATMWMSRLTFPTVSGEWRQIPFRMLGQLSHRHADVEWPSGHVSTRTIQVAAGDSPEGPTLNVMPALGVGTVERQIPNPAEVIGKVELDDDTPARREGELNAEAEHKLLNLSTLEIPEHSPLNFTLGRSVAELKDFAPQLGQLADFLQWTQRAKINAFAQKLRKLQVEKFDSPWRQYWLKRLSAGDPSDNVLRRLMGLEPMPGVTPVKRRQFLRKLLHLTGPNGASVKFAASIYLFIKFAVIPTVHDIDVLCDDIERALNATRRALRGMLSYAKVQSAATMRIRLSPHDGLMPSAPHYDVQYLSTTVPIIAPWHLSDDGAWYGVEREPYYWEAFPAFRENFRDFPTLPNYFTVMCRAHLGLPTHTEALRRAEDALFWDTLRKSPSVHDAIMAKSIWRVVSGSMVFGRFSAESLRSALKDAFVVKVEDLVKPLVTAWEITPLSFILDWIFTTRQVAEEFERVFSLNMVDFSDDQGMWASVRTILDVALPPGLEVRRVLSLHEAQASQMISDVPAAVWLRLLGQRLGWGQSPSWVAGRGEFNYSASNARDPDSSILNAEYTRRAVLNGVLGLPDDTLEPHHSIDPDNPVWFQDVNLVFRTWGERTAKVDWVVKPMSDGGTAQVKHYSRGPLANDLIARFVPQLRFRLSPDKLLSVAALLVQALPVRGH